MITNGTKPDACIRALEYDRTRYIRISVYTVNQLAGVRDIVEARNSLGVSARIGGKILLGVSDVPLLEFLVQEILDAGVDYVSIKAKRHCSDDPEFLPEESKLHIQATLQDLRTRWSGRVFGGITKTQ